MLQIIGFLGCAYLIVKAFELFGQAARYKSATQWAHELSPEEKTAIEYAERGRSLALIGACLALAFSAIFGFWLFNQGDEFNQTMQPAVSYSDCLTAAKTVEEMQACKP